MGEWCGTATKESKVGMMEEGGQLHVVSCAKMLILILPDIQRWIFVLD